MYIDLTLVHKKLVTGRGNPVNFKRLGVTASTDFSTATEAAALQLMKFCSSIVAQITPTNPASEVQETIAVG